MKDALTVTNERRADGDESRRSEPRPSRSAVIFVRATPHYPYQRARGSSTTANSFRATFNGTNQSSKVEKLLSQAIIKMIDNASVTVHWLMNLPPFCEIKESHISPHIQLDNSIRFRLGIRSFPSHFLEASLAFARSRS